MCIYMSIYFLSVFFCLSFIEYDKQLYLLYKTCFYRINEDKEQHEKTLIIKQCYFLLQQAIDEDEQGDKDDAIELYAKAVEYVTKYPELMQGELRRIALQALDRAETLKGK